MKAGEPLNEHERFLLAMAEQKAKQESESLTDIFSGEIYDGERNITCPVCRYDYTHIREVYTLLGSDENEAMIYRGTEAKGRTSERRSALAIVFDCEGGHAFELRIQQHKGINMIEVKTK